MGSASELDERTIGFLATTRCAVALADDQSGAWTEDHRIYEARIIHGRDTLSVRYQCNQSVHGDPDGLDVIESVLADAGCAAECRNVSEFYEEFGYQDVRKAVEAYEECRAYLSWFGDHGLDAEGIESVREAIDMSDRAKLRAEVEAYRVGHGLDRPDLPEGWRWVEDVKAEQGLADMAEELAEDMAASPDRDIAEMLGEVADSCTSVYTADLASWMGSVDNLRLYSELDEDGELDGIERADDKVRAAQYEANRRELHGCIEEVGRYALCCHLQEEGAAAIGPEALHLLGKVECDPCAGRLSFMAEELDEGLAALEARGLVATMGREECRDCGKLIDSRAHALPRSMAALPDASPRAMSAFLQQEGLVHDAGEPARIFRSDYLVHMMDDGIREAVHADLAPCSAQAFLEEYARRHAEAHPGERWMEAAGDFDFGLASCDAEQAPSSLKQEGRGCQQAARALSEQPPARSAERSR